MTKKIYYFLFLTSITFLLSSCEANESVEIETVPEVSTPILANEVSNNLTINSAEKIEGTIPAASQNIPFTVVDPQEFAFLNEGFDIELNVEPNNVAGAYFQIKDNDGTLANSFYKIDLSDANLNENKNLKLDIDFKATMSVGTFCYVITLYDANGGVSDSVDICVTIKNWGGNDSLLGVWEYSKTENLTAGSSGFYDVVGDNECTPQRIKIHTDELKDYETCDIIESSVVEFKVDGTYEWKVSGKKDYFSLLKSLNEGVPSFDAKSSSYSYVLKGNWSYIASESRLVMYEYNTEKEDLGKVVMNNIVIGEALYFANGTTEISTDNFTLTQDLSNLSGVFEALKGVRYKQYFTKR
ncbi:hypothetical protein [Polaribacter sp. NJDZ03]|uniref:hypothetical protein n=1 Tax=Polaribacter sp. NJDZ03 TaxID=2855841 RepID=UPI001C4A5CE4|nr:hypothetical protein [Polaribacter sp. NJDZ03]